MRLTLNYIETVIAALTLSCDTNTVTKKPCKNTFVATENPYLISERSFPFRHKRNFHP